MRKILVSLFIGVLLGMVLGVLAHRQWLEWFPSGSPFAKAAPPATQPPPPAPQPPATTPPAPASTPAPPSTPPASTPPPPTQTAPPAPAPPTGDQFADVPTWIPVYPSSKLTGRTYSNGLVIYSFSADVKAAEALSFYEGQLRNAGWTPESTQPGLPTRWEKGDQSISVSVTEIRAAKSGQGRSTLIQVITAPGAGK